MMNVPRYMLLPFVIALLFGLHACAEMKGWLPQESPAQKPAPVKQAPQKAERPPERPLSLAANHMKAGQYQQALDIYGREFRRQPQEAALKKEYAKSVNEMKSLADTMLEKGNVPKAGRIYYTLRNNYASFSGLKEMLSFDDAYLNTKLSSCRKNLSRQGFEQYRKGNIDRAIALWQDLLAIDPENKDIKAAVRTATQQQKNLQDKDRPL